MKRTLRISGLVLGVILLLLLTLVGYVISVSSLQPPEVDKSLWSEMQVEKISETDRRIDDNFIFLNEHGNWEMYLSGSDFERGVRKGKLCGELLYLQEKHFIDQIRELVPDESYLRFLKYFVGFFNRNLNEHVPLEYQREIYGVALSAPDTFDFVSEKYDRMMNYHAAHDIGHALQNLAMVGCTSFAADGAQTEDGGMLAARNFDFFAGDGFAENKIVALVKPDSGYAFLSVTWAGMIGVVSGMNEAGLTITLNAGPSEMPTASATPISILAREILQYAATISEAEAIAKKHKTFVSEALMITSAADGESAIIEKTPTQMAMFRPESSPLICSNHFQSESLSKLLINSDAMSQPDSPYRFSTMEALLDTADSLTPEKAVEILRHQKGLPGDTLGTGNPMAINQLIAHHGIVFQPEKRLVWVSSGPYQLGAFAAYDLSEIFGSNPPDPGQSASVDTLLIPSDEFLYSENFAEFRKYKIWLNELRKAIRDENESFSTVEIENQLERNPYYYLGYQLAGEYLLQNGKPDEAAKMLRRGLELKIPYNDDRERMNELLDQTSHRDS